MEKRTGISNRETPQQEETERQQFPPRREGSPEPEDAAGRSGDASGALAADQTSHKTGGHSLAEKEQRSRYTDRSHPATHKVPGAFGREPGSAPEE